MLFGYVEGTVRLACPAAGPPVDSAAQLWGSGGVCSMCAVSVFADILEGLFWVCVPAPIGSW
jgi:hypothetical protein